MIYPNHHQAGCPWYPAGVVTGGPNLKWCEETVCAWVSEPANTWSNISYLVVALILAVWSMRENHRRELKIFPLIVFLMGALSFIYHQSNIYGTQILDFTGMFLLVGWTSGMNLIRASKLNSKFLVHYILGYTVIFTIIVHLFYLIGIQFQFLMMVGAFFILVTEAMAFEKVKVNYKWFFVSLLLIAAALTSSILDHTRVWCDPSQHGIFSQGHSWWHWLSGPAMFTIYLHYKQIKLEE